MQVTRFSRKLLFLHQKEECSALNRFACFHWLKKLKERKEDNFKIYKQKSLNAIFISCNLWWKTSQRELVASIVSIWSMFCSDMLKDVEWRGGCNNQSRGGGVARDRGAMAPLNAGTRKDEGAPKLFVCDIWIGKWKLTLHEQKFSQQMP